MNPHRFDARPAARYRETLAAAGLPLNAPEQSDPSHSPCARFARGRIVAHVRGSGPLAQR